MIKNRYDFIMFFDVQDGNPNGDPDAGNLPRIDAETGKGLVTDVCLKRKVRNYVQLSKAESQGYRIFVKEKAILNDLIEKKYDEIGIDLSATPQNIEDGKKRNKDGKAQGGEVEKGKQAMCSDFFDIRAFGAVMSTGPNAGQVRGPIQLTFGRSIDPIVTLEHSITRMAVATKEEAEKQSGDNRTMGRKFTVPYGLYRAHGFISANLAEQTGFSDNDLNLFWEALQGMFDQDHSAARGLMAMRKVIIFRHESPLGNASAHKLFEMVPNPDLKDKKKPPRAFTDYENITIPDSLPENVTITVLE